MKKWSWLIAPAVVIALAAAPALAGGKPKSGGTPSISIASIDGTQMAASTISPTPSLGDTLTFATSTGGSLAGWEYPVVVTSCYQDVNGDGTIDTNLLGPDIVYSWVDKPDAPYLLGAYSSIWTQRGGGPADCRAELDAYGWKANHESVRVLASTSFHANG
jgi:hypothetical protein